jgi:hypothetical protein
VSEPKPKPFDISKRAVLEGYRRVKANKGAAGVDEQSLSEFERDLKGNLYKLWNRLSSGSYFPPPVRAVEIPKRDGSPRMLAVPDRRGQDRPDGRGRLPGARGGASLPPRLLWLSAGPLGAGRGRGLPGALLELGLDPRSGPEVLLRQRSVGPHAEGGSPPHRPRWILL